MKTMMLKLTMMSLVLFVFLVVNTHISEAWKGNEIEAIFQGYEKALQEGNIQKALIVFDAKDKETMKMQKKRVQDAKGKIANLYCWVMSGDDDISFFNRKYTYYHNGMIILFDKDSQSFDGFKFIAQQRKKDKGWDIRTKEIKKGKDWVSYYEACAYYYKYEKGSTDKQREMYEKIVADYGDVRGASAKAYQSIGDIYFEKAENEFKAGGSTNISDALQDMYIKAIETYNKSLNFKDADEHVMAHANYNMGISYYRLGNFTKAKKLFQDVAASGVYWRTGGKWVFEHAADWIKKIETGK